MVLHIKNKDAIANFNKEYVKTELFPKEIARKIAGVEEIRHASDYDDFYIATRDGVDEQISIAEEFIKMVEVYCMKQMN